MSTLTTGNDGEKKPPDNPIKGQEALERLRLAHATEPPKEQASRSKSARPRFTRFYDEGSSGEDSVRLVKTGTGNRQLTKKDRITLWVRLVSRIPKHLADKHNAEVDAELARQQASSDSGKVSTDRSTSDKNQSTKTRPNKKLLGQYIKLQLETFLLWLRKRTSMATTTPGNPAPATPAPATTAPGAPAQTTPAGNPTTQSGTATGSTAGTSTGTPTTGTAATTGTSGSNQGTGQSSGPTAGATQSGTATGTTGTGGTSGTGQNTGGPVQNVPTAQAAPMPATPTAAPYVVYPPSSPWWNYSLAIVALVAVTLGLCFYVYRDQNVVHENRRAFEVQSDAQAEKARATEEIERARSVQIRAYDEVNQLKQEVEGIRRQHLQIPPPVFQTIPPTTQPGTVPTPSQTPAQLAPDTKESGSSHTVTNNITIVHRVEVRHENPALTIVPNGYWSPTPMINRYGYHQGFNGFYYQYGW